MSKWSLLKEALVSKKRNSESPCSVHRFQGFQMLHKKKVIWGGFFIHFNETNSIELTADAILERCYGFMNEIDINECVAKVFFSLGDGSASYAKRIVPILEIPCNRVHSQEEQVVTIYIRNPCPNHVLTLPVCDYWVYTVPVEVAVEASTPVVPPLFVREKPKDLGLNVQSLLSNKLHGVDNTGNICVWPAESLLLHTLLTESKYKSLVIDQRILEIGGGMTALAGLGLAVSGICSDVTVTDGHPDCVTNQVPDVPLIVIVIYFPLLLAGGTCTRCNALNFDKYFLLCFVSTRQYA
jgi:hypothetical protein